MMDKLKGYKRIIALVIFMINSGLMFTGLINKETSELIVSLATALGVYGSWTALTDK